MSKQSKNDMDNILYKIPVVRTILKKIRFFHTIQKSLKWCHKEVDLKEISKTFPPASEKIELHCSWITEAYAPSNIDNLISSLKKLGWEKAEMGAGDEKNLTEWIVEERNLSFSDSWMSGGLILSHNDLRFSAVNKRYAKLPKGVDYANLSIRNIASSLTIVTIQFIYCEEITNDLCRIFYKSYKTKVKYHPSVFRAKGARYLGVVGQKRRALKKKIDAIHTELYAWFSKNLPGHFSLSAAGVFPTADLITSRLYEQNKESDIHHRDHYANLLFDYAVDVWRCKKDAALEFRLPWCKTKNKIAALFGNYNKLTQNTNEYGGKGRLGLTNKLNLLFDKTMSLWAIHNLLLSYEQQLSAIRDRAISHTKGTKKAIKNLETIRNHFLAISTDVQAIGNDVAAFVKKVNRYSHEAIDFEPPHYYKRNNSIALVEFLRKQSEIRTEQLIKLELRVTQAIITSGNLISSIMNLRVQRSVYLLTLIIVLLTIITVFWRDPLPLEMQQQLNRLNELIVRLLQKM